MSETLSVSAIKNGTVIDHIPQGQALGIIHLLSLSNHKYKIMVGMNLPSKRLGIKDLIKIEDHNITDDEANEIVVFAPPATINIIKNFEVKNKIKTHLPNAMHAVFTCPNPACITQAEAVDSHFYVSQEGKMMKLTCHYCEKVFHRDQLKVKI